MSLLSTTSSFISTFLNLVNFSRDKKKRKVEALTAIRLAILETKRHLNECPNQPNLSLSRLWLAAFEKVENAGIRDETIRSNLMLFQKANFWADPELWRNSRASMELIPSIEQLELYCEPLIAQIENR